MGQDNNMYEFKNISGKNFLSIGKAEKNIDFINGITVIKGKNGNGKSTIFEMLYFILTGKSYRGIKKKASLINHTNKKDLEVQLNFKKNNKDITIIRRMKPKKDIPSDVLIIDGKKTNFTDKKNFQIEIEKLLGVNEEILKQQIFLSQSFYEPFVELSPESKRKFISRVFGLNKFKEMEIKIKEDIKSLKYDIDILNVNITNLEDKINYIKENEIEKKKIILERINNCNNIIEETKEEIKKNKENLYEINIDELNKKELEIDKLNEIKNRLKSDLVFYEKTNIKNNKLKNKISNLEEELDELGQNRLKEENEKEIKLYNSGKIEDKKNKLIDSINKLKNKKEIIQNNLDDKWNMIKFYEENDKCPTCNKELTDKERDTERDKLVRIIKEYENKNIEIENKIDEYNKKIKKLSFLQKKIEEIIKKINNNNRKIKTLEKTIETLEEQIEKDVNDYKINKLNENFNVRKEQIKRLKMEIEKNSNKREHNKEIESHIKNLKYKIQSNENFIDEYQKELENLKNTDIKQFENELEEKINDVKRKKVKLTYLERIYNIVKKDDGIKKYIVQQYLPTLNKYVNQYAKSFNFHNKIVIDNGGMNISIFHRGKEKEIGSYSSGELQKINMSVLFAFQSLLRIKSGIEFPLLLLDEITAPLDTENAELFYKILKEDFSDMYIMIINHRIEESDSEYVDRTIEVVKNSNGFSDYKILS